MKNIIIAKRYAAAAFQAMVPEKYPEYLEQLHRKRLIFGDNTEVQKMLNTAFVNKKKKLEFINSALENAKNKEFWSQIMTVMVLKNRSEILKTFFNELEELLYNALNQKKVSITFAHEPDEETIEKVKKEIERMLQKKIVCDIRLDKEIIGGFIAIDKNKVIDASVRSNLNRFAKTMLHSSE